MNVMRFAFARGCCNTIYKSGVFILEDKRWFKVKTFNPNIYHFLIKQYYNRYFLFIACFYLLMQLSILLTVSFPTCCNVHWNLFRLPFLEDGLKGCIYIISKCDLCCKKMLNLISLYNFFSRNLT